MISSVVPLKPTILVIEDNPGTGGLIQEVLEDEGYAVILQTTGELGLDAVQRQAVDLVLLDIMLPGMNGLEVCRRLKAMRAEMGDGGFLPIVMLTARAGLEDVVAWLEAGADEYLRKPFRVEELLLRVRAMVRIVSNERALARRNRELEEAVAQERQTRRQLEALEAITAAGLSSLSLEASLERLIETMARVAEADAGAIFLVDSETGKLTVRAAYGHAAGQGPELRHAAVAEFVNHVAGGAGTIQTVLPGIAGPSRTEGERTLLGVPLVVQGRRLGVATLGRQGGQPFSADEVHLFEIMADRAALAIENVALHQRSERDVEMKTLLLRELQHRVRNNLQAISGILSFQLTRETTAKQAITGALRRIKSIAATQDFLFKREGGPIPLRPLLDTVAHELATLWALPGQGVQVTAEPDNLTLPMERAQIVALVVHELLANAFQHGLAGQPGQVSLHISLGPGGIEFAVTDTGEGLPEGFDLNSNELAGLRLVQILLQREFRTGLKLDSGPMGTRATFAIPLTFSSVLTTNGNPPLLRDRPGSPNRRG